MLFSFCKATFITRSIVTHTQQTSPPPMIPPNVSQSTWLIRPPQRKVPTVDRTTNGRWHPAH
jgi:hypothetical protein